MVKSNKSNEIQKYRSALKQAETALALSIERNKSSERMANLRLYELAHEIKNPLNSILGFSEMLMTEILGPLNNPKYKEYSENIHEAAEHLLKICQIELERENQDGSREYHKSDIQQIEVNNIIDQTLNQIKDIAVELGVEIKTSISDDFPVLEVDPIRLQQVLFNLLSNAIKFTPKGGHVEIKAKVDDVDGAIILVIQDNGLGISPEDLIMITEPFKQGENISRGDAGSGLGLGIVKRLTDEMGVAFELNSDQNFGTVATLKFETQINKTPAG